MTRTVVQIRCSAEEKTRWIEAAGGPRQLSEWIRSRLNVQASLLSQDEQIALDKYQGGPDWHSSLPLAPADTAPSRPSGKRNYEPDFK